MPCRQPTKVLAGLGFSDAQRQLERLAQQLGGLLECRYVRRIVVFHRLPFSEGGLTVDTRRLDGRESAVDGQRGAVDVRGVVADEECDRGRDLFGFARSLRWSAGDDALD